jgi:hypothetical protein
MRVFENRLLRRIFGQKDEILGYWRKVHNEELQNLYPLPNVGKSEGKMLLGGLRCR